MGLRAHVCVCESTCLCMPVQDGCDTVRLKKKKKPNNNVIKLASSKVVNAVAQSVERAATASSACV